jgi:outer membrane protein assembly factor BamB
VTSSRAHRAALILAACAVVVGICLPSVASAAGPELWATRYDGVGNAQEHNDEAVSIAASPDGSKVFVTGTSDGPQTIYPDYATVAYDATTGAELWVRRYSNTIFGYDIAASVAVAPDGSSVFVTGSSDGYQTGYDYFTIAYDASTGAKLWSKRYDDGANEEMAHVVVASPDGTRVFVVGESWTGFSGADSDYGTVAYDAVTGAKLWVKRYDGPAHNADYPYAASVSPDGSALFVMGKSKGSPDFDYATVAYRAKSGKRMWAARYDGPPSKADYGAAIAVSPDGSRVAVTGASVGSATGWDYATVAYDAATGAQQWVARYTGQHKAADGASAVAFSGDGAIAFVTGDKAGGGSGLNYGTVAYDAGTGAPLWAHTFDGSASSYDNAVGVVAAGSSVVVTGTATTATSSTDYTTIAYDGVTGASQWIYSFDGGVAAGGDAARAIAAGADGGSVYVTGVSYVDAVTQDDYATVAYPV